MTANAKRTRGKKVAARASVYYDVARYNAKDSVGYAVAAVRQRMAQALDVAMAPYGFTAAQWPILRAVAQGTLNAAELSRTLDYDTGSMTRMLSRLEKKGVIKRVSSPADLRVVELRLTPAGRAIYPKLRQVAIRLLNDMLNGLSDKEIERTHASLNVMFKNLDELLEA